MRKTSISGNAAKTSIQQGLQDVQNATKRVLIIALNNVHTPSANVMNHLHWSCRHRLRRFWKDLLDLSLSGLNATAQGSLTVITLYPDAKSFEMRLPKSLAGKVIQKVTASHSNTASRKIHAKR